MCRSGIAYVVFALLAVAILPTAAPTARAADVSVTLIAKTVSWHVGSESSSQTTIAVTVGDTLRLRVENRDSLFHTFTANQFPAATGQGGGGSFLNVTLPAGRIFFWNYTVTASDVGNWQFYCIPHSSGVYPARVGMIGVLAFTSAVSPPSGISPLLIGIIILIVIVAVVAAVALMMRRKKAA